MKCKNCGTENPDGSRFCATCGKPLEQEGAAGDVAESKEETVQNAAEPKDEEAVQNAVGSNEEEAAGQKTEETAKSTAEAENGQPVNAEPVNRQGKNAEETVREAKAPEAKSLTHKKSRGLNKLLIGLACAVVVVVIAAGLLISRARRSIDLNNYITFETTGYNGYGSVYPQIDWQKIQKKYDSRLKFTKEFKEQYGDNAESVSPVEVLQSYVSVEMQSNGNFSNKEKAEYKWTVNKDYEKYVKCNLKYKDKTYKVKGLEEVKKFDAFKDLEVSFSGINPDGAVSFDYTGSDLTSADFLTDAENGTLENGDKIKVYLDKSMADSYAANLGKLPEKWEKEYTVKGLWYYVTSAGDIDDDTMQKMKDQAEQEYNDHVESSWTDSESLESLTYMGDYLLESNVGNGNELYLIYHAKVRDQYSNDDGSYDKVNDVYWYIHYGTILADGEGNTDIDLSDYGTPGNFFKIKTDAKTDGISSMVWKYYGYPTLDDLYNDIVDKNADYSLVEDAVDDTK